MALVVLVLVATAVGLSVFQTPVYEGTVKLLLQSSESGLLFDDVGGGNIDPARRIATEIEVIRSEPVRAAVRDQLGSPVPRASVVAVGSSDILDVRAQSTERARASALASAYASAYLEFRRSRAVDSLGEAERKVQAKITDFQRQIDALDAQPLPGNTTSTGVSLTRDHLVTQQALFRQRLDELQVDAELKTGGAQIVTPGVAPTSQVRPTLVKNGLLALLLGLGLGIGLAFLLEFLDDSIKTKEELERWSDGLPVLGLLPVVEGWSSDSVPRLITITDTSSPTAEAFRSLRTSLQFLGVERAPRIFQIVSANAGEGKTTTASNLGVVLALAGRRIVVVDCDLRRPRLHEFLGRSSSVGFTSVYLREATLAEAVQPVPGVENLFLLPSGPRPPNQSELLASRRTAEILAELLDSFDIVLVDCPPVLPVTDSTVLSAWVDATIVVTQAGVTPRSDLRRALEMLRQVSAPVVGTVLNQVQASDSYGYRYGRYEVDPVSEGEWVRQGNGASLRNAEQRSNVTPALNGDEVQEITAVPSSGAVAPTESRRPDR